MNSPTAALVWDIWRRGRRFAGLVLACLGFCLVVRLAVPAHLLESNAGGAIYRLPMVLSFLLLMGIFNCTEYNPTREWNGFPQRLFLLPVPTWRLVAVPMLTGVLSAELLFLLWIKLTWGRHDIVMPEWFATVLAVYMVLYQLTLWAFAGFRILRTVALSVGGVSSLAVVSLPFLNAGQSPWLTEKPLTVLVTAAGVAAFLAAWAVVARQRSGGGHRWNPVMALIYRIADRLPRRTKDFTSPAAAQFWFEWRRTGLLLPACTLFALVVIFGPFAWVYRNDANFTCDTLWKILATPLALGFVAGKNIVKPELSSANLAFPTFLAIRPFTSAEFVASKMKVAALSVAITWVLIVGGVALWLSFCANTHDVSQDLYFLRMVYPHSWLAVIVLSAFLLVTLTWRLMVSGLWAGLSGKGWYYFGACGMQVIAPLLLLLAYAICHTEVDSLLKNHLAALLSFAGWALVSVVVVKAWLAALVWGSMTPRRTGQYLLVGMVVTLALVILGILSPSFLTDTYRPEHLVILTAFLVFPLVRPGLAPLFLEGNRHGLARALPVPGVRNKSFLAGALLVSGAAIWLGMDPGRPPYQYVDAGGPVLRMLILGQGGPTVVFENGRRGSDGEPLETWELVQPEVAKFARTVSYDQADVGLSAAGPAMHDGLENARELHAALQNAHVLPPYIMVGHSFGGPFIRVFAGLYPGEVAGLVLVDPTQEAFIDWNRARHADEMSEKEWSQVHAALTQAHESRVPPGIPVVLITGIGPPELPAFMTPVKQQEFRHILQVWLKFHTEWLAGITNAEHIVTEKCGHDVPLSQPGLIVDTVRKMVDSANGRASERR